MKKKILDDVFISIKQKYCKFQFLIQWGSTKTVLDILPKNYSENIKNNIIKKKKKSRKKSNFIFF